MHRLILVVLLAGASSLPAIARAAPSGEVRALLQKVEEDLKVIDAAQMQYGGVYPAQLITDISRYVALPMQLEDWRAAAQAAKAGIAAGRYEAAAAELEALSRITGAKRQLAEEITSYWMKRGAQDRRLATWRRFVQVNGIQPTQGAAIDAAVAARDAAASRAEFALGTSRWIPEITALLDAGFVDGRRLALDVTRGDRAERLRTAPCPRPAEPIAPHPSGKIRVDGSRSLPTEGYYPGAARREGRDGRVGVEVEIDATGCATRAVAIVSSGWPDIDAAALAWTIEAGAFTPAAVDGQPAGGRLVFWVNFEFARD